MDTGQLPATREEILEEYLEEIKMVQPVGPYLVGGHCFGAIIAYELVRLLEDQEDRADKLLFIDEPAVMKEFITDHFFINKTYNQLKAIHRTFKYILQALTGARKEKERLNTNHLPADLEARRDEVMGNFRRLFNSMYDFRRIIDTPMLVVKAFEPTEPDSPRWHPRVFAKITTKPVEIVRCPGDHFSVIVPPNVTVLAQLVKEKLLPCP